MEYTSTITSGPMSGISEEEIKKYNEILNVLVINMYGEATRDGGIYIKEFELDGINSKITYHIAKSVASLYGLYIYLDCSFWTYVRFLIRERKLFKKRITRLMRNYKKGHTAREWLEDISRARDEKYDIWWGIYDFLELG